MFIGVSGRGPVRRAGRGPDGGWGHRLRAGNPDPEIDPDIARHAAVVATGRSDQPNQINNVLAFPGIFRGLLDGGVTELTLAAQCAAAQAIADAVPDDERDAHHIVPDVFDEHLVPAVARAVMNA